MLLPAYFGIISYGAFSIRSGLFLKALCYEQTNEKKIALTFDDGPHPEITPILLNLLKKYNVKAGFFCIGKMVENSPDILRRTDSEGHLIGNHTYSHAHLIDFYSTNKIKEELYKTENLIKNIIQKKTKLFRPPYGVTNPAISNAVRDLGYITIGWNIRSLDTVIKDEKKIIARVIRQLKPGAIVLLHEKDMKVIEVVKQLLAFAAANGIQIVRPDELLTIKAYD